MHLRYQGSGETLVADRPALPLMVELEDFFVDLVGSFDDARAHGCTHLRSAIGSRFEAMAREYAARLEALSEGPYLGDHPV
jgi:hypothetical protein